MAAAFKLRLQKLHTGPFEDFGGELDEGAKAGGLGEGLTCAA